MVQLMVPHNKFNWIWTEKTSHESRNDTFIYLFIYFKADSKVVETDLNIIFVAFKLEKKLECWKGKLLYLCMVDLSNLIRFYVIFYFENAIQG